MANVISSLLVGIGFDFDKNSAKQMESGMDSMKSKALQLGAVVTGAFGFKALTTDFAHNADSIGKFGEVFGVTAGDIRAFGMALETEGGTLESFMSQIESIERARARIKVGDVAFFAPAGKAGINPNLIADARNATEAYLTLADQMKNLDQQSRINVAEALGLDEASIRLLSKGRNEVERIVAKYRNMRPLTEDMTEAAAEFNRNWIDTKNNIGLVADTVSMRLIPALNDASVAINGWFGEGLQKKLDVVAGFVDLIVGKGDPEKMAEMIGGEAWMYKSGRQWFNEWTAPDEPEKPRPKYPINIGRSADTTATNGRNYPAIRTGPDDRLMKRESPDVIMQQESPDVIMQQESPDAIMQQESPQSRVIDMPSQRKDAPTQRDEMPSTRTTTPPQTQNINVNMQLDGMVIERKVIKVVDGMVQSTIDDITSNTAG